MMEKISLGSKHFKAGEMREIAVREMKSVRSKIGKDLPGLPKPMMEKCQSILWES